MIGVDTNVLARHLTGDDAQQSTIAGMTDRVAALR